MNLRPRDELFCHEYLVDFCGQEAVLRAKWKCTKKSAKEKASKLLTRPDIQARIKQLVEARIKRTDITADRVLLELARIGFATPLDVMAWDETGRLALKASEALTPDEAASVQGVTQTEIVMGQRVERTLRVVQHDKKAALKILAAHTGVITSRRQVDGKISVEDLRALAGLDEAPEGDDADGD